MKVKTISEVSKSFCVFRVSSKDKAFIDKEFNALHDQNKMK